MDHLHSPYDHTNPSLPQLSLVLLLLLPTPSYRQAQCHQLEDRVQDQQAEIAEAQGAAEQVCR